MAASVIQENELDQAGAALSLTLGFTGTTTAGNTYHVIAGNAGNTTVAFTDSSSDSVTTCDTQYVTAANTTMSHAVFENVAGGASVTVTATFGTNNPFPFIIIREIGGVNTSSLDVNGLNSAVLDGSSVSVALTTSAANEFISGYCQDTNSGGAVTSSTGTTDANAGNWCTSHQTAASAGSNPAGFSGTGVGYLLAVAVALKELASGGGSATVAWLT